MQVELFVVSSYTELTNDIMNKLFIMAVLDQFGDCFDQSTQAWFRGIDYWIRKNVQLFI